MWSAWDKLLFCENLLPSTICVEQSSVLRKRYSFFAVNTVRNLFNCRKAFSLKSQPIQRFPLYGSFSELHNAQFLRDLFHKVSLFHKGTFGLHFQFRIFSLKFSGCVQVSTADLLGRKYLKMLNFICVKFQKTLARLKFNLWIKYP